MTETHSTGGTPATIRVDQFGAAPPAKVWRMLTEPELMRLRWRLEAEGAGTRVFLEHTGFDRSNERMAEAFNPMGPGRRDVVLPRLADVACATISG
jgi:hypothetical protein